MVADALSRRYSEIVVSHSSPTFQALPPDIVSTVVAVPSPTVPGISYQEMSSLQQSCPKVQALCPDVVSVPFSRSELWCDSSTGVLRPFVPEIMRRLGFKTINSVSHPGKRASRRLISRCLV